jgi:CheY-like chemotaxis protein
MAIGSKQIILVVEDSEDDYFAMARAFKKACLLNPVHRCTNGDQALDYLYKRGEFATENSSPRPGMILLDLNLPGTDGREVLRIIKADLSLHKIPVIVLTTSDAESDVNRCYEAGANSYVKKPVELAGFVDAIARIKEYWIELAVIPKETK